MPSRHDRCRHVRDPLWRRLRSDAVLCPARHDAGPDAEGDRLRAELEEMTSASNRNGGFACEPAAATEAAVPCPCCGGAPPPPMIDQKLPPARRPPAGGGAAPPPRGRRPILLPPPPPISPPPPPHHAKTAG